MKRRTFITACASATAFIGSMFKTCKAGFIALTQGWNTKIM